jgi:hypothetical protein
MSTASPGFYVHPHDFVAQRRWTTVRPPRAPR